MQDFGFYATNGNKIIIPKDDVAQIFIPEFLSIAEKFQKAFGVFNYMKVNTRGKFEVLKPIASEFLLQPHQPCVSESSGNVSFARSELTTCPYQVDVSMCNDLADTCFSRLVKFRAGTIDVEEVNSIVAELVRVLSKTVAQQVFRDMLLVGFHESFNSNLQLNNLTEQERRAYKALASSCEGLLAKIVKEANRCNAFDNLSIDGCKVLGGTISEVLEKLYCCAVGSNQTSPYLRSVITSGFYQTGAPTPVFLISANMMPLVVAEYTKQLSLPGQAGAISVNTVNIEGAFLRFYSYNNVPIVPVVEINSYDHIVEKTSYFAGLTVSGNLQLGTSYDELPTPELTGTPIAMTLYQDPDPAKKGLVKAHSVLLTATAVSDPSAIVYDFVYG